MKKLVYINIIKFKSWNGIIENDERIKISLLHLFNTTPIVQIPHLTFESSPWY